MRQAWLVLCGKHTFFHGLIRCSIRCSIQLFTEAVCNEEVQQIIRKAAKNILEHVEKHINVSYGALKLLTKLKPVLIYVSN